MAAQNKLNTQQQKEDFLELLAKTKGIEAEACRQFEWKPGHIGISTGTLQYHMRKDPDFRQQVIDIADLNRAKFKKDGKYKRQQMIEDQLTLLYQKDPTTWDDDDHKLFAQYDAMHAKAAGEESDAPNGDVTFVIQPQQHTPKYNIDGSDITEENKEGTKGRTD